MSDADRNFFAGLAAVVASHLEQRTALRRTITISLPGVAAVCWALFDGISGVGRWAPFGIGVIALVCEAVVVELLNWWRAKVADVDTEEALRFRIAMKDALQPVTELVASMPLMTPARRRKTLQPVAICAVGALVALLKNIDRVRAVVFAMAESGDRMEPLAHQGRGSSPSGFEAGTKRGDRAIEVVRSGETLYVPDLGKEKPEEWEGSGGDYCTFISAPISAGEYAYGMLTVDAPQVDALVENDRYVVEVVADLLAIAFAEAVRPD